MVDFFATEEDASAYPLRVIYRRGSILSRGRIGQREEGTHWCLYEPLDFSPVSRDFPKVLGQFFSSDCITGNSLGRPYFQFTPEHSLLVDIETTGLSQSPLFLVGFLWWNRNRFYLCQLLARYYEEEPAILASALEIISHFSGIISFNGRKFDLPYIRERAEYYEFFFHSPKIHIDVLELARKVWKPFVPNCRLQTLERHFCKRCRRGDIPSSLIPKLYDLSVKSGDCSLLEDVLFHNFLDLLTTAELFCYLMPIYKER